MLTTIISLTAIGLSLAVYATRRRTTQSDEQVFGDVPYLHGELIVARKLGGAGVASGDDRHFERMALTHSGASL